MLRITLLITFLLSSLWISSQQRWANNYLEGEDPFGESIIEHYDKGYFLAGRFGPNYPDYSWLLKTNINGNVLWQKVFGEGSNAIVASADMGINDNGDIFLVGLTWFYSDSNYDPLIMKLNSCGEKEWCRVFVEEGNNYSNALVVTPDGGVAVVLMYMSDLPFIDRICLARFDIDGNLQWKHCYNSTDTALSNQDAWNLTLAPDGGFLISATCGYKDPEPPHVTSAKPYYIKTDSLGNLEWEKVVYSDVGDRGGEAWSTVLSPDSNFYFSSISHYYRSTPYGNAPALLKMDMAGNVIDIYDIASPSTYGKLFEAKFNSDTTLMASVAMGYGSPKAVEIDTMGNIVRQANLLENEWMALTEVTFDNKLLYLTNKIDDEDNFNTYLFKFNNQLQSDTIYSQIFNYDSLCPYPIVNDTIVQDNCGIIVGNEELLMEPAIGLEIFPNPATKKITVKSPYLENGGLLQLVNIQGKTIKQEIVPRWSTLVNIDISAMPKGIYLLNFKSDKGKEVSAKVVVE